MQDRVQAFWGASSTKNDADRNSVAFREVHVDHLRLDQFEDHWDAKVPLSELIERRLSFVERLLLDAGIAPLDISRESDTMIVVTVRMKETHRAIDAILPLVVKR